MLHIAERDNATEFCILKNGDYFSGIEIRMDGMENVFVKQYDKSVACRAGVFMASER